MVNKCSRCKLCFSEKQLELSHDIPKYMNGTDKDGRHYLCKFCHLRYELNIIKLSFMLLVKNCFSETWKRECRKATKIIKKRTFNE